MKRIIFWLVASVLIALMAAMLLPAFRAGHGYSGPGRPGICEAQMLRIASGMESYKTDFSNYPTGSVSVIFFTLTGDNSKRKNYVQYVDSPHSAKWKDSFVDPWNTPYRIEIQSQTNVIIHSAGINQIFGDEDDMVWDGAAEQLVKP